MIAHVAESGEQRGRVVLELTSSDLNPIALAAALRIAAAFNAEIESLFVEDQRLFDVAAFSFSTEVSLCGRRREPITTDRVSQQMRHLSAALNRRIATMAAAAEVPFKSTVVRNDPVSALARACEEVGPWNVIALTEPLSTSSRHKLRDLFDNVIGATGVIIVGRNAQRTDGPVLVAVDDVAHLEAQLRAADRLNPSSRAEIIQLVLVGDNEHETVEMEGQARLLLTEARNISILQASPKFGSAGEVARMLQRTKPGLVISRFGGALFPRDVDPRGIAAIFECPLLLMR